MSVYEQNETYVNRTSVRDRKNEKKDPSEVSMTIKDPCGNILVDHASMTSDATGEYFYNYDIQSNATYGRYTSTVSAKSAANDVSKIRSDFYVMPWNLPRDIRQITGIGEEKTITNDDLSDIAWHAYRFALRDVFEHHYEDIPKGNPQTGAGFNGTNTTFQTPDYPIADVNGDGIVSGSDIASGSCATDIDSWWIDTNGSWHRSIVRVDKSRNGEISIFQADGVTAIPANNEGVYVDYWIEYKSFDEQIFRRAVAYLAAHEVEQRFSTLDKTTLADINANRPIVLAHPRRYLNEYKRYINMTRKPRCGVV